MSRLCQAVCSGDSYAGMEKREPPIVDLEKIIADYVWENWEAPTLCCCRPDRCKKKNLQLKIDWSVVKREDINEQFIILPGHVSPPKSVQLFRTKFNNNTTQDQEFTFKTQRQTQSTMEMCVQEGLSIGGRFQMAFPLIKPTLPDGAATSSALDPEEFQLTSSLGGHITWNVSVSEKMAKQEAMTWGVDSVVKLRPGERAVATLSVLEAKVVGLLTLNTTISITSSRKKIPIDILDKKTGEMVGTVDLSCKVLCDYHKNFTLIKTGPGANTSFGFTTKMLCDTVYCVQQNATVQLLREGEEVDEEPARDEGNEPGDDGDGGDGDAGGIRIEEVEERAEESCPVSMSQPLIKCA